jgi:hypothetical protein
MMQKILLPLGLVFLIGGSFVNGLFVKYNIGGYTREGMRLIILSGILLKIIGLILKNKKT